jgi:hypothetical protein
MRRLLALGCALVVALAAADAEAALPRCFVIDGRLSALRAEPYLSGALLKRLRVGRVVYVVGRARDREGRLWVRVAVTRRTRGWLVADAIARPGETSGEGRLRRLMDDLTGIDRLEVARLAADRFPRLRASALAAIADEAGAAAATLSERANRRLGALADATKDDVRALMLSDPGLDRFNRLGVFFDVDTETRSFVPRPVWTAAGTGARRPVARKGGT